MKFLNKTVSRCPNSATYRYYLEKFVDNLLLAASAAGAACALAFLLTL